ncbi:16S rRNA (guanine(527)-N(7))-methyltransferase RsmG [Ottowia sp.]|uniref:16S rRNA (guanine(527)-N(7))-methyltransferase RsmG n=1 Tax=Ottowia sp. TaxID=1898956 RepID=UPI003A855F74
MLERLQSAAHQLGLDLTAGQLQKMLAYLGLLMRWNKVYNLTALRDPTEMLTHHVFDSLAVLEPLRRHVNGKPARVLDVGSGGGLPGVMIAVGCPELSVTCVDAVGKKAAFIQQVAGALALPNLKGLHARVESVALPFDIITSRAFASLPDFARWSADALAEGGVWVAMKGKHPQDEIDALPPEVEVFHVEPLAVPELAADRCLVWMRRQQH